MLTQKDTKYTAEFIKENIIIKFVHNCLDQGVTVDKSFGLLDELITMLEKKQLDYEKWQGLINQAIEEANNKEGVLL